MKAAMRTLVSFWFESALAAKQISSCQSKLRLQLSLVYCVNIREEQCQGQKRKDKHCLGGIKLT